MNHAARQLSRPTAPEHVDPEMLLIFRLSKEYFGIAVTCVHEILDPIPQTRVPNASPFAAALVNVRGAIAPLIDIRQRLRMAPPAPGTDTRIIVLELPVHGVPTRIAMTADSVEEVIEGDPDALKTIPELGAQWPEIYLRGVARHGEKLIILLNTETLFRPEDERP